MEAPAPEPSALFPLTVFDKLFERTTFVTGWLVEGMIDAGALASALDKMTEKWRMLSGRLHPVQEGTETRWYLKIPLGPLPPDYRTYSLTTSTSSVPLSTYVPIPFPRVSKSPPLAIFLHQSTPRQYAAWKATDHPLTCWNIVYFPAEGNDGVPYTCIGFSRCHGVFDGGGAALVMNALIAELKGNEWPVPPLPHQGLNTNPVEEVLSREASAGDSSGKNSQDYAAYTVLGIVGLLRLIAWHLRERWWRGAERRIVLMPKAVLDFLVEDVRSALRREGKQVDNVTTGDVLVAWMFKTIYSTGIKASSIVHCTNLASFRSLLPSHAENPVLYPHNAFVPLPYPVLPVSDIRASSLHALTNVLAASRTSLSLYHVASAYKQLQMPCFPEPPDADETVMVSNVSASRILESDWTLLGAKRTICGYRYQATPTDLLFTNAVYIAGRLDDGTAVLDVTLNKARFDLLSGEIQRLSARLGRNQRYDHQES